MSDSFQTKDPPLKCIKAWRHYASTGSTNHDALQWINQGAPDMALISADHQTRGRGREDRTWVTHAGAGLAFSLVCKPSLQEESYINRFTALAALAILRWMRKAYHLKAHIKWPNDVLINGRKIAGILVETLWEAEHVSGLVIGVGINVNVDAIPQGIALRHPAGCIEVELGRSVNREQLMWGVLNELCILRKKIASSGLIRSWNTSLAYKHTWVNLHRLDGSLESVKILRVKPDGCLQVASADGLQYAVNAGELEISYNQNID